MLLIKNSSLFAFIFLLSGLFCLSCVDVPSNAPPPPVLNAQFRFISITPDSVTAPTQFKMADAPGFTNFRTITLVGNATPTGFDIYPAGSKYIVYLGDTLKSVNFETDEKATLVLARNSVSSMDTTKARYSSYKLSLGYSFNPTTYKDTTIVRFFNLMLGGLDTVQIRLDSTTNTVITAKAAWATPAYIKVPKDSVRTFFFTGNLIRVSKSDTLVTVFKDPLMVTGSAFKVKTVFIYDKYDTSAANNAKVKLKELDEN